MTDFFADIPEIRYEGPETTNEFAFRHYDPDLLVMGKPMREHLRFAVAYWHNFAWAGTDPFGDPSFERPWFGETMEAARAKADVAFDMFARLGVPFFCFHDADVRPEGSSVAESRRNLEEIAGVFEEKMAATGVGLLWGTANLFGHRRFMAGAATNPDPDVFAYSAATVKACLETTHRLNGANYVLWGGREGYETLLNTDLGREAEQAGRFLSMVVEHKHKIGFPGQILVEPKPQEPTKHQYDHDVAAVHAFLQRFDLEGEVKMNIEAGHAVLAGHSFEHELAHAASLGLLGSIDINRNDYQSGWDTDQFPNDPLEATLAYYEVLKAGGLAPGGTNFDAKLRRQSIDPADMLLAHVGGMDTAARGLKAAAAMLEDGELERRRQARYAGWDTPGAREMLASGTLESIAARVESEGIDPAPRSGGQERFENLVNRYI